MSMKEETFPATAVEYTGMQASSPQQRKVSLGRRVTSWPSCKVTRYGQATSGQLPDQAGFFLSGMFRRP